jgi:hypothetical protein
MKVVCNARASTFPVYFKCFGLHKKTLPHEDLSYEVDSILTFVDVS